MSRRHAGQNVWVPSFWRPGRPAAGNDRAVGWSLRVVGTLVAATVPISLTVAGYWAWRLTVGLEDLEALMGIGLMAFGLVSGLVVAPFLTWGMHAVFQAWQHARPVPVAVAGVVVLPSTAGVLWMVYYEAGPELIPWLYGMACLLLLVGPWWWHWAWQVRR